jgi:hypothetical protein
MVESEDTGALDDRALCCVQRDDTAHTYMFRLQKTNRHTSSLCAEAAAYCDDATVRARCVRKAAHVHRYTLKGGTL